MGSENDCLFDGCTKSSSKFCIKRLILFLILKLKRWFINVNSWKVMSTIVNRQIQRATFFSHDLYRDGKI